MIAGAGNPGSPELGKVQAFRREVGDGAPSPLKLTAVT